LHLRMILIYLFYFDKIFINTALLTEKGSIRWGATRRETRTT
jgi:hypothetical protein